MGKRLIADVADIKRRRARLLQERSELDLRLAVLESEEAEKLAEIAGAEVELTTGIKRREAVRHEVTAPDELAKRAARSVARVLG